MTHQRTPGTLRFIPQNTSVRIVLREDTILLVPPNTSGESIVQYLRENVDCNGFSLTVMVEPLCPPPASPAL